MFPSVEVQLRAVHARMKSCRKCSHVCGGAVHGPALETPVLLVGQAPGPHEESRGRPFAHTAGKTLFRWLGSATGADEATLRETIYFAAVLRCFPGKNPKGKGDRPPNPTEIENCREFLAAEVRALKPRLILAVGRTAIHEVLGPRFTRQMKLEDVVGTMFRTTFHGHSADVICLPHPSGLSRWPRVEPGLTKLASALELVAVELTRAVS